MAAATKDETLSIRITKAERANLDADALLKGLPTGTIAAAYLCEGSKRSRFPAIDFRDGTPGRVAYLVGTRWPIWMIVDLVNELDGDMEAAAKRIRKPVALVKMAWRYAEAYPAEIKASLTLADNRNKEAVAA